MKGPDDFRCPGCETPTRGGRFCGACLDERVGPMGRATEHERRECDPAFCTACAKEAK
jgi:hypothetical protein